MQKERGEISSMSKENRNDVTPATLLLREADGVTRILRLHVKLIRRTPGTVLYSNGTDSAIVRQGHDEIDLFADIIEESTEDSQFTKIPKK